MRRFSYLTLKIVKFRGFEFDSIHSINNTTFIPVILFFAGATPPWLLAVSIWSNTILGVLLLICYCWVNRFFILFRVHVV